LNLNTKKTDKQDKRDNKKTHPTPPTQPCSLSQSHSVKVTNQLSIFFFILHHHHNHRHQMEFQPQLMKIHQPSTTAHITFKTRPQKSYAVNGCSHNNQLRQNNSQFHWLAEAQHAAIHSRNSLATSRAECCRNSRAPHTPPTDEEEEVRKNKKIATQKEFRNCSGRIGWALDSHERVVG
jgi:hypothetical protein